MVKVFYMFIHIVMEKEMATHSKYSFLENPMDRGASQATVHGVARDGHNVTIKPPPPPHIVN